ncbi:MAG: hypothetical protein KF861_09300, partial [Planctomycetaceae bacterium]|nr:hypothetical protein [Planctomycetaceae bacterium]
FAAESKGAVTPKRVAAVVTEYRHNSHADVILTKIMEGWKHDGGPGPKLELAGAYFDQFPDADMAREMCGKHNVPIFDTIEKAITLGGDDIAVDGVISIGEHGKYPYNEKRQHLYPRLRFFNEIADCFEKHGRVVPVFNDKHLSTVWDESLEIYNRARALKIPFMAGSSIPVAYRKPAVSIPMNCEIEAVVGVGYSDFDAYGYHALEFTQCFTERRRGAETGVEWVECLQGERMWEPIDKGLVSLELLEAALKVVPTQPNVEMRSLKGDDVALFLFQYRDGLLGAQFMLNGLAQGIGVAVKVKGQSAPVASFGEERPEPRYPHFAFLTKGIEQLVLWGKPVYPVERTLLTGGILDRAITSQYAGGKRLETPELAISYQPVDYPYAQEMDLNDPYLFRS